MHDCIFIAIGLYTWCSFRAKPATDTWSTLSSIKKNRKAASEFFVLLEGSLSAREAEGLIGCSRFCFLGEFFLGLTKAFFPGVLN